MNNDKDSVISNHMLIAALVAESHNAPATALTLREDALAVAMLIGAAVAVVDAPRDCPSPGQLSALRGALSRAGVAFIPAGAAAHIARYGPAAKLPPDLA